MNNINCIIIDDEPIARKIIREYVSQTPFLKLSGEFENPLKAQRAIKAEKNLLVFLDINMPKLSGIEWLKNCTHKPMVIITTAYPEYALEGYELDILDYLLKPFGYSRFLKAVQKANEWAFCKPEKISDTASWIFVRTDKKIEKIEMADVLYFESAGNYVKVTTTERQYMTYMTLKALENQLSASVFVQVHQSYTINMARVNYVEGNEIRIGDKCIPIGRSYKIDFLNKIEGRLLKK